MPSTVSNAWRYRQVSVAVLPSSMTINAPGITVCARSERKQ